MGLPTRAHRQALFNAFEVALGVLLVGMVVRFCTVPGSGSIIQVTRDANNIPCGPDGALDFAAAVKNAMIERRCVYRAVELPSHIPLYLLVPIGFAVALVLFELVTRLTRARGALLRPWGRLLLLGIVALTAYPVVSITASSRATVTRQALMLDKLADACHRATRAMAGFDKELSDGECAKKGYETLAVCLKDDTRQEQYEVTRGNKIKDALDDAKVGTPPRCEPPPPSSAETFRTTVTANTTTPAAKAPSTSDDTTHPPVDAGVAGSNAGGASPPAGDTQQPAGGGGGSDGTGVNHPEGCTTDNCQEPAYCDGTVCKPPRPDDKRGKRQANGVIRAAIIAATAGIGLPLAILIVSGAGDTVESEVSGSTLDDTAREAKNNPSSPEASRVIARGGRRTGQFKDALDHVRPSEAAELRAQMECLRAIQSAAKTAPGTPDGCTAPSIDGLHKMFSSAKQCEGFRSDSEPGRELREWVAKCVCKNELGNSVLREIACVLPPSQ